MARMTSPRLLTPVETAAVLGTSVSTLKRWRAAGTGPPWRRLGGRVRYPASAVEAYIDLLPGGVVSEGPEQQ